MAETFADIDAQIDALAEMIKGRMGELDRWEKRADRLQSALAVIATTTTDPEATRMAFEALEERAVMAGLSDAQEKQRGAETRRLQDINAELLAALEMARECIAYCRLAHRDVQSGDGIPVEVFIEAAIANARAESPALMRENCKQGERK